MTTYIKDYPRPQFVRKEWTNLNGEWEFRMDDQNEGEKERWFEGLKQSRKIQVPFTCETQMSGIGEEEFHPYVWYEREITVEKEKRKGHKTVLHFEGSDFLTKVWVNGRLAGSHKGGYSRFSFDITDLAVDGVNRICVKVEDVPDRQIPRGKQRWIKNNFGCWYVQTTGIWKTVWMEYVPLISLASVKMTPDLAGGCLRVECAVDGVDFMTAFEEKELRLQAEVTFEGRLIAKASAAVMKKSFELKLELDMPREDEPWGVYTWSPENPRLYDICFFLHDGNGAPDEVRSYFGMREIRVEGEHILLNGQPLYQRLILDQGYWEKSHLTPPDEESLIEDIDKIHALGYNGVRKHQKIEDERFLYWCDVKGMLVWSEAPAAYEFSDEAVSEFVKEWTDIVRQNYNHPSIITWVPFNESWGIPRVKDNREQQHFTESVYHLTKSMDKFRPVIVNDGWEHTVSDIITLHDYEEFGEILKNRYVRYEKEILAGEVYHCGFKSAFANGYSYRGQPVIISEFGGIAFAGQGSEWGYGSAVETKEAFLKRFDAVTTAIKEIPYVCGYCYTQVTDVQQEINGLMDIRRNFKVSPDKIKEINERQVGELRKI